MTTQVEATVRNGVLMPDIPLPYPDQLRVRLTIEPNESWSPENAVRAWERFVALAAERPINTGGVRFEREDLHERG